jgi:hypothetical protein
MEGWKGCPQFNLDHFALRNPSGEIKEATGQELGKEIKLEI